MSDNPIILAATGGVPPLPMSIGTTLVNKTGAWRYVRPLYQDKMPPCQAACPAGNDIVRWLALAKEGRYEEGWRLLTQENPFPGICGRVCPYPCEGECNRAQLGGAIAIHALERFLADEAAARSWSLGPIPRPLRGSPPVAIIGAGPAGLSCAYHLARLGYAATVYEAADRPGGMMRLIPRYRLPVEVLEREIGAIEALGVRILTGQRLGDNLPWEALRDYGAILIATGQGRSRSLGIPGKEAAGMLPGIAFLSRVAEGQPVPLGRRVLVIGGGNTALDAARTARRLGAEVTILYRRSRAEMPASEAEIEEAEEEGVAIHYWIAPSRVLVREGRVAGLECIRMAPGEPDESGRRRPVPIAGSEHQLAADTIIPALGQEAELEDLAGILEVGEGRVWTDSAAATSCRGIFAGGDVATGYGTVAHAIGSGKRAALAIDRYLRGQELSGFPPLSAPVRAGTPPRLRPDVPIVRFEDLNVDRLAYAERPVEPRLDGEARCRTFAEVNLRLEEEVARAEAERCFSCGTCNGCDVCLIHCPDVAIHRSPSGSDGQGRYVLDYDYCKGCGICVTECPRNAMAIEKEASCEQT